MPKKTTLLAAFFAFLLLSGCFGLQPNPTTAPSTLPVQLHMATFDSGFGGFFTAKSMEELAPSILKDYNVEISITHYGDTKNAPYGGRTTDDIAKLTQRGVGKALSNNASVVVIACNTASTQYKSVVEGVSEKYPGKSQYVLSIITPTINKIKNHLDKQLATSDKAIIAMFATPVTVQSMVYPNKLAAVYKTKLIKDDFKEVVQVNWKNTSTQVTNFFSKSILRFPQKKTIFIYQFAPGNWVSMIEEGAPYTIKSNIVLESIQQFFEQIPAEHKLDVLGFFCTHYPVFQDLIKKAVTQRGYAKPSTEFIAQGPLAAAYAYQVASSFYKDSPRAYPLTADELLQLTQKATPKIIISGDNLEQTSNLVKAIFPKTKDIIIHNEEF
jgi:glutamate racemase